MCSLPDRNFLVTLTSMDDASTYSFKLTTPCVCDIHQWVIDNAGLFPLSNPRVTNVDDKALFHLPSHEGPVPAAS